MQPFRNKYIDALSRCVTDERLETLMAAASNRTQYLTVVLEDIYQSQNVSAVLRTCECIGVQDVHVLENRNRYIPNPKVVMGATKWLTIHRYAPERNVSSVVLHNLKNKGYRIVVTSPHANGVVLPSFDYRKGPFALVFGTELTGVSGEAMSLADEYLQIPMYGLTESYNLSVSAGICLYHLMHLIRQDSSIPWGLSPEGQSELLHHWLRQSVRSWKLIEKRIDEQSNLK